MSAWLGKLGSKGPISSSGTVVAVFLLDGTRVRLKVTKLTKAAAICMAIADKLGLVAGDSEYGLYTCAARDDEAGGRFSHVKDSLTLASVVKKWTPEDLLGSARRRLYFKRQVYVIESPVDKREDEPESVDDPHHRLALAEATHNFLECNYRFPEPNATEMAALLLHCIRGPFVAGRDTEEAMLELCEDVVPRYLLTDRTDVAHSTPAATAAAEAAKGTSESVVQQKLAAGARAGRRWASSEVYRRVGCVDAGDGAGGAGGASSGMSEAASEHSTEAMAMTVEQAAQKLTAEYAALAAMPRYGAERRFVQRVKEFVAYGSDIFVGKRTWRANDADATEEEVMDRTEDVTVSVAYSGIVFTGLTHPLGCEEHKFDSITKWTLSEDSRVFAFQVEEQAAQGAGLFKFVVYIVTDQAPEVEQSVDRFVDALVAHSQGKFENKRPPSAVAPGEEAELQGVDEAPTPDMVPDGGPVWTADGAAATAAAASAADAAGSEEAPAAEGETAGEEEAAQASAEQELPPGWIKMYDDDGDAYYYNETTEETQWEPPEAPAVEEAGAEATAEAAAGDALPEGWEVRYDDDGDAYYYNQVTEDTQWERPDAPAVAEAEAAQASAEQELPPGWIKMYDDDGDAYYYNETTEETQWEPPTA
ncbi:hypothetical protein FNF29_01044 [Cafeteria roenbergensis]|uniref:WW domain-containing protein n=2 Tax=Cafeteria roenbergensis TaxID=33653 RepID=A0A5A8CUY0_CAFRO|nr:hypothetical protein FNF29_01044 [Cafeteria roenbergensis]KAA0160987.1 hypothetical protein FNF31_04059 [Cafeteria roenbergensis]KAA0164551.1 hypothetical protein FNF28_03793 [Cafeteria roenbergensis]|eukprot:KAA0156254.1 hypothetical protein FNF29_01044 [Cafeteria roenbergensis]